MAATQGNSGSGAAHVWRREWVKGAPGTAPFPTQIGTPSPLAGAVSIVYGTFAQLPQPPDPGALSGSLGMVVNTLTALATLYIFDDKISRWRPILTNIAWGTA